MFALDPVLVLAGGVAGVCADFKHVDDDYFDFDGLLRSLRESTGDRCQQEKRGKEAHK